MNWHANPQFHKPNDFISVRKSGKNGSLAKEIWEYDKKKRELAMSNGYQFIAIWESEMTEMTDDDLVSSIMGVL